VEELTVAGEAKSTERPPIWDAAHRALTIQIFGAGGAVGRELTAEFLAVGHPPARLALYGRRGRSMPWSGGVLRISPIPADLSYAELAFLCTPPEFSRRLAPHLTSRGTRVIDLSGAFRTRPDVPMVAPLFRDEPLGAFTQMITLPSRFAAVPARPLLLLEKAVGLEEVVLHAMLSAASGGAGGVLRLRREIEERAGGVTPHPATGMVGNLRAAVGEVDGDGRSVIEKEIESSLTRLLARSDLPLEVDAVETDVERCDAYSLSVRTRGPISPLEARRILGAAPGIELTEDPGGPSARSALGSDVVQVGRIRAGSRGVSSLCFFATGDQLRLGAAAAALSAALRLPLG
jgi:aspartate-semialdehyde dehydrogenase